VSFGWFGCFLLFVVVGARNKFRTTLLTLILTSLKPNTQFVCEFACTLLNLAQIILDHSHSKQFSQDVPSNRQPPAEAQSSLW
jgi:hypothetical protein